MKPVVWWILVLISGCTSHANSFIPEAYNIKEEEKQFPVAPSEVTRDYDTTVAFHATFKGTLTGTQRIPYDHLLLNEGNGFDILYHAFRAPRAGMYVFSVEAISNKNKGCVELRKNHKVVTQGKVYWRLTRIAIHAPVRLRLRDIVYVKLCGSTSIISTYGMNSFTGHRVSA